LDSGCGKRDILTMQFTVTVAHDEEEGVWFVESSNVPGLNAEAPTLDALVESITDLAPLLISANVPGAMPDRNGAYPLRVEHVVSARVPAE
jgi:predicted RNase H-like HicB family nuclease